MKTKKKIDHEEYDHKGAMGTEGLKEEYYEVLKRESDNQSVGEYDDYN